LALAAAPARAETSLSLEDAIAMARRRHPTLGAGRAQVEIARARRDQALAGFVPSATGSFAYVPQTANFVLTPSFGRFFGQTLDTGAEVLDTSGTPRNVTCLAGGMCPIVVPPTERSVSYQLFSFWTASLGLSWFPWEWGRTFYGLRAATRAAEAQKESLSTADAQVVLDVKLAFFGALAADAAVGVAEEAVSTQRRHVEQVRAFVEVGTRTKIDLSSAKADLANAELNLARVLGTREAARAQLAVSLGEDAWGDYRLVAPPEPPEETVPPANALAEEAVAARTELREVRLRARSFDETARSLRGAYLPALGLNLGPTFSGTDLASLTTNFTATLSLGYPVGGVNPLLIAGQVREARANRDVLVEQERAIRNAVRLEATNARAQLVAARQALIAARKLLEAAHQRRDLAEGRYQAGVGAILELSDAELGFENARFQEVRAVLDLQQARARLERAAGR
jgi:outer membrane protein